MADQEPPVDPVVESGQMLAGGDLGAVRRLELVRKLVQHRKDPRVGPILLECLSREQDPELVKTIILSIGLLRDRSHVSVLMPYLGHSSLRVMAATIKTLCRLDANLEVSRLHPLIMSRDGRARTAAVMALASNNTRLGVELLEQLAASARPDLRQTAVLCLARMERADSEALLIRIFEREPEPALVKALAKLVKKDLTEPGLEALQEVRSRLLALHPEGELAGELKDKKLAVIEKIVRRAYKEMDMSAGRIGTLEGKVEKTAQLLETAQSSAAELERARTRKVAAVARSTGFSFKPTLLLFVVMSSLLGLAHLATKGPGAPPVPEEMRRVEIVSALGKIGDFVTVEGTVLRVHGPQSALSLVTAAQVVLYVTCPPPVPAAVSAGGSVRIEGTIAGVKSAKSLMVTATKLSPDPK